MGWNLEQALDRLRSPACYPDPPDAVEQVVTHVSVVCLAGDRVYKLKRPVQLPFFDGTEVETRRRTCEDEVRLNRRLCPDVYLGVVPLREDGDALRFLADGPGEVVDWAVCMRRLPDTEMLDRRLAASRIAAAEVRELAEIVARFHERAARSDDVRRAGAPDVLIENVRDNFEQTARLCGSCFDWRLHGALRERVETAMNDLRERLLTRLSADRVVEGHGDLHARNICMTSPPSIYDCVEFSFEFRCGDVATDIAFLAMDLRYRGRPDLADAFIEAYIEASGDRGVKDVLPELIRYRAMVRAKVAGIASADATVPAEDRDGARGSARRHLRLAAATRVEDDGRVFVVACGMPASGKSYVLERLARQTGWLHLQTDAVRKALAGVPPHRRAPASCYTAEFKDRTYAELLDRAAAADGCVLLDGNFATRSRRAQARAAARRAGARCVIAHFTVDEATARRRLAERGQHGGSVSDADTAVFDALRGGFEPPGPDEPKPVVAVGELATPSVDASLDRILAELLEVGTTADPHGGPRP